MATRSNDTRAAHAAMPVLLSAAILACSPSASVAAAPALPALHTDQFRDVYEAPKNPAHQALYERLKAERILERFRTFLSFIRLPRTVTLKLAGCDGENDAWYDADELTVTVCYEYLEAVQRIAPADVTPEGVTPDNAVLGPLLEVFLHEVAHVLFDQLRIPLLGREEDAADQLAAFMLLHLSERTARDTVLGVAWMYDQQSKEEATLSRTTLADVHGLSGQRFYNLLCIAYGAEPGLFGDLIDDKRLPQSRAETCAEEYRQVAYAVKTLMFRYVDESEREKVFAKEWVRGKPRTKTAGDTPRP